MLPTQHTWDLVPPSNPNPPPPYTRCMPKYSCLQVCCQSINLKMAIRAETCSWYLCNKQHISNHQIVVFDSWLIQLWLDSLKWWRGKRCCGSYWLNHMLCISNIAIHFAPGASTKHKTGWAQQPVWALLEETSLACTWIEAVPHSYTTYPSHYSAHHPGSYLALCTFNNTKSNNNNHSFFFMSQLLPWRSSGLHSSGMLHGVGW